MERLATIYLTNEGFADHGSRAHGHVEEHLSHELSLGWTVKSVSGFGGVNKYGLAKGWLVVVLEKPDE